MTKNFSKDFENHTFKDWGTRKRTNSAENYLFNNYFIDNNLSILEAGTGSGICSFYLEDTLNFKNITAFDILPKMIDSAKEKAKVKQSKISFFVGDASNLSSLPSNSFDYLCYLQQILCMLPPNQLNIAMQEAYRLGSKNSIYLFSFLDWKSRWYNPILSLNINLIRFFKGHKIQKKYLPEVKFNKKINWQFYKNNQHPILWGTKKEFIKLLTSNGFKINSFYTDKKITNRKGCGIYFVCSKA